MVLCSRELRFPIYTKIPLYINVKIYIITENYILILSCTLKKIDTLPNFFSNTYIRSVFPTQIIGIHIKEKLMIYSLPLQTDVKCKYNFRHKDVKYNCLRASLDHSFRKKVSSVVWVWEFSTTYEQLPFKKTRLHCYNITT